MYRQHLQNGENRTKSTIEEEEGLCTECWVIEKDVEISPDVI